MCVQLDVNPARAALLVMDLQNDIASPGGKMAPDDEDALARFAAVVDRAAATLHAARQTGLRIVHVAHRVDPELPEGTLRTPLSHFGRKLGALREGTWVSAARTP